MASTHPLGTTLLVIWGLGLTIVGVLVLCLWPLGRKPAIVAAALHLPVMPFGTIAALFALYALVAGPRPHPLSEEYVEVASMTEHRGYSWAFIGVLIVALFMPFYAMSLVFVAGFIG